MENQPNDDDDRAEVCFTPQQIAIRAFIDSLNEYMPGFNEGNDYCKAGIIIIAVCLLFAVLLIGIATAVL